MALRRALSVWQWAAAAVLPLWLLLGYAIWGASFDGLFALVLLVPVVLVVEIGLALLFSARRRVRRTAGPTRADLPAVVAIGLFQVGVVGVGFFGPATPWFALLATAAAIGGFWFGGRRLTRDVKARVDAIRAPYRARRSVDAGEYVAVKPSGR